MSQKMSPTPNPLFKFNRDGFSVHVTNVSEGGMSRQSRSSCIRPLTTYFLASKREVFDLFNSLIGSVLTFIRTLISRSDTPATGDITKCEEAYEGGRRLFVLSFATQDAAKCVSVAICVSYVTYKHTARKALCMSGYNVDGSPLYVCFDLCTRTITSLPCLRTVNVAPVSDAPRAPKTGRQLDIRRNLYVLGLPFDLTKCVS